MNTLFKSESGKQEILRLYDQKLLELNIDFQDKEVNTGFGKTHIIVTGNPENPPLIAVHGSNACAPIALETYQNLHKKFQVFAVDVPGQPNKSESHKFSMKDHSYGQWLNEVIDKLGLQNVTLVGFSLGGLIILKTLIHDEKNIKQVFLSSPAFIVNGNPFKGMFRVFFPMKKFMKTQKPKYIEKFLSAIFTEKDEFALQFISKVVLNFNMDFSPLPVISKKEAQGIQTPITLIAANQDIMFPGEKMIKRAEKIFPSLTKTLLLENSKHVQSKADNERIEALIKL